MIAQDVTITMIFGATGSGKSQLSLKIIRSWTGRKLIIDGLGKLPGRDHVARFPADVGAIEWEADNLDVVWSAPPAWPFWKSVGEHGKTPLLLLIDESDLYWPHPSQMTMSKKGLHPAADLVARHRHYGIQLVTVSQRPMQTPPMVRDLAHEVYCLAIAGDKTLKYLADSFDGLTPPTEKMKYHHWKRAGNQPPELKIHTPRVG